MHVSISELVEKTSNNVTVWILCIEIISSNVTLQFWLNVTQVAKQVHEKTTFSKFFFQKNRYLSDYVVGGCPKYIFGKLRSFLKISEKNFKIFLLGDSKRNWLKVPNVKNHFCRGWKRSKSLDRPKNRFFQSPRYRYPNPTTENETSN